MDTEKTEQMQETAKGYLSRLANWAMYSGRGKRTLAMADVAAGIVGVPTSGVMIGTAISNALEGRLMEAALNGIGGLVVGAIGLEKLQKGDSYLKDPTETYTG